MPGRKAKPPRLKQRKDGAWIILDRNLYIRTGCTGTSEDAIQRAAEKLADHIGAKHQPNAGERDPDKLPIADVIVAYEQAKAPRAKSKELERRHNELVGRLATINEFFGSHTVGSVRSQICRDYVAWRMQSEQRSAWPTARRPVSSSSARRELEDLRAAINLWHAEHTLKILPKITLPAKRAGRDRWLTRAEAARLLAACLGFVWDSERGRFKRARRDRMTRDRRRHIARFILLGLYSGRREQTLRRTQWIATPIAPWLDLERMVYHGRGRDERVTKKRRPPAAIAYRLRPHLLRWQRLDRALEAKLGQPVLHIVHKGNGQPLADKIKTGWNGILADAGLGPDVVRHILKHTAATWLMQSGVDIWKAAGFLGTTAEQLEATYTHHHPDFQDQAAGAYGGKRGRHA